MRTNRGKRSEAFWPSIVMKKWLNIKPKVYEFSEDEVDTETESEDDACSLKDERMHVPEDHAQRTQGNLFTRPSQTSGTSSTDYRLRHRRGKSETLRAQYINTKDVRVTIGTWNVAGRLPNEDLEIDDWLCTEEPADIYIIGQIFWFGDLNYRINMLDTEVRKLVALRRWDELLKNDQLSKELQSGHVFDGWNEGVIDFPPTYKYETSSDRYVGENPKEGEKRSPAWCDRVLWLGKGIKQLSYERAEIRLSDHRPVSSNFLVEVEVLDHRKLKRAINYNSAAVHPEIFPDEES